MNVSDLVKGNVTTVYRHEDIRAAARLMRERHVGYLVVVEPMLDQTGERPIGVLTDRDIVTTILARDAEPRSLLVDDVMTREPFVVEARAPIETALRKMRDVGARRIPVVDALGRLVGVLSLDDVLDYFAEQLATVAGSIRKELSIERAMRP
jgi:CBS domain-containing protein